MATTMPMNEISIRPGSPRIRPENTAPLTGSTNSWLKPGSASFLGGRIDPGLMPSASDSPFSRVQRHVGHAQVRVARFDLPRQRQRRLRRAARVGFHQVRIEQVVELVVP